MKPMCKSDRHRSVWADSKWWINTAVADLTLHSVSIMYSTEVNKFTAQFYFCKTCDRVASRKTQVLLSTLYKLGIRLKDLR